ncbi:hypothetical protein CHLNCDRAFT_55734, partial [Chlorella variabilis]
VPGLDLGPSGWPAHDTAFIQQLSAHLGGALGSAVLLALKAMLRFQDKQSSFGMPRGGYGGGGGGAKGKAAAAEGPGVAQQRFGNAKSISSSAFHGQDNQESEYEKQQRLSQFQ